MMQITPKTFKNVVEFVNIRTENSLQQDPTAAFTEGKVADLSFDQVRAVYPLIHAIHSDRMTKNFTLYPYKAVLGKDSANPSESTGFRSFVTPTGKPILREHRAQDSYGTADVPMGRVIYSGVKKYISKEMPQTPHTRKGWQDAGTVEGSGHLVLVPAITCEDAIPKILGNIYHTVSIGSSVASVIESISGKDIAAIARSGNYDDMPDYRKGQLYKCSDGKERLSFWSMDGMHGNECSYVNMPADDTARNVETDLGVEGVQRLMMGEKKPGAKEYALYDAKTGEKIESWFPDEGVFDETFSFVDSLSVGSDTWWISNKTHTESVKKDKVGVTESLQTISNSIQEVLSTMNIKDQILECLKNPQTLSDVAEKLEGSALETFQTELRGIVDEKLDAKLASDKLEAIGALGRGESFPAQFSDKELFATCQEAVVGYLGDWTEEAARIAFFAYTEAQGTVEWDADKDKPVTFGEMFELNSDHSLFSKETGLSREGFVDYKPGAWSLESLAAKVQGKEFGGEIPLICSAGNIIESVSTLAEVESMSALVDVLAETWQLSDEENAKFPAMLEDAKLAIEIQMVEDLNDLPLVDYSKTIEGIDLPPQKVIGKLLTDSKEEYLLPLLSICRTRKISKKEITEASKAYEHFSPKVQKILLDKLSETPVVESVVPEEIPTLAGVENPVAETATEDEMRVLTTKDTVARTETWKTMAQKPLRPAPKQVRTQKETK